VEFPGGKRMIIDGGGFPGSGFDVGRNVVAPFLWREKIMSVDYLVLSHPQADHMNGLVFLAETFHPKQFWYNGDHPSDAVFRQLMEVLSSRNMNILDPASLPAVRDISGVTIEVLHPDRLTYPSQSSGRPRAVNDRSLVLRLSYRGRSFLFPGDIEHRGEGTLLKRMRGRLRSHVLLSPHHGSRTSNSEEFLSAVAPEICVISCGKKNRFGFPHSSTLQKLRTKKCRVLRTDREGAVQVTVSETGKRDQLRTYRGHWEPVQCW
jgi:competence protein ComEC